MVEIAIASFQEKITREGCNPCQQNSNLFGRAHDDFRWRTEPRNPRGGDGASTPVLGKTAHPSGGILIEYSGDFVICSRHKRAYSIGETGLIGTRPVRQDEMSPRPTSKSRFNQDTSVFQTREWGSTMRTRSLLSKCLLLLCALAVCLGAPRSARCQAASSESPVATGAATSTVPASSPSITLPGPLRSFLRMAAISQQVSPEDVLPLFAHNVVTDGYRGFGR